MIPRRQTSPLASKITAMSSNGKTRIPKTITSINGLYQRQDRVPKRSQNSLSGKTFHTVKPSLENLVCGTSARNLTRGSRLFETGSSLKSLMGSSKKESAKGKNVPPKTSNNIYAKFGNKQADNYMQHASNQKNSKKSTEVFKDLCNARIRANTLKTALNNELFMLRKRIDTEKRQVVEFLDSIKKIADALKRNLLDNYDSEFGKTFEFYSQQINALGDQKAVLDDQISRFNDLTLTHEDFADVMDQMRLPNQLCQFPFENQELRGKAKDQVVVLLQEVAAPVPVMKTISAIDDYNEYVSSLRDKFNISQTSTIPKKNSYGQSQRDKFIHYDANKTQGNDKGLNLTLVKDILSKNDQVLNKLAEFSLDELHDETESQDINDGLRSSLSSVQLKCSEHLNDLDDSKILLISN